MTAQQSDLPMELPDADGDAVVPRRVVRRASQLCLRAEPHTDQSPGPAHLTEGNRQLRGFAD
ncbi:MAG: hypothetical protein M3450_12620 [Actinomycetota bacterium]|nr:hypothetical protein [Actinomycetota bacterium]